MLNNINNYLCIVKESLSLCKESGNYRLIKTFKKW